jgi:hypothetical protein
MRLTNPPGAKIRIRAYQLVRSTWDLISTDVMLLSFRAS